MKLSARRIRLICSIGALLLCGGLMAGLVVWPMLSLPNAHRPSLLTAGGAGAVAAGGSTIASTGASYEASPSADSAAGLSTCASVSPGRIFLRLQTNASAETSKRSAIAAAASATRPENVTLVTLPRGAEGAPSAGPATVCTAASPPASFGVSGEAVLPGGPASVPDA